MNDTITVCGIVATEPRHLVTETGIAITSLRLASPSRRWDRQTSTWGNGPTNWYTVTAFRSLAANVNRSLSKGDRVLVTGRVRIRNWERDGRGGTSVEIDAEGIGHDLAWGISNWMRLPRHVTEANAAPGSSPRVDHETGEVHEDTPDAAHPPVDAAPDDTHPDDHQGADDSVAALLEPGADERPDHPVTLDAA
ncbi:single-stranded DNA-binding protein [Curtobacterium herbarum]|uniref:Single-stranded DNA-binding protein n=1 Tax=Curtobacterium herbarum TaxID=150122 RepID=A0ABP4K3A8_9MICO|nr:single-stranded DNA-binding protein [Curtobacterium herbarum]MBM7476113.1 single-strand DNA-binding protein [Curtobacterium herbarum]MCS6544319.1 single-stranded DNA-binding protein [Curtobacterium herbarum]